jgi:phosphate:Na+ symporter
VLTNLLGGVGVFLIGMVLLTEGLKLAAGDDLKRLLVRFTGGTARSVLTGAAVTALVQSSSATTLTTIGFVSAGLLSFRQAVGVIFGANLGTTSTAWLVAVVGLKMSVLPAALPMVGAGALLRLLGRGRLAHAGLALAGFGLIFVGIDTLQAGMAGLSDRIGPASLPGATVTGRVLLVLVGAAMTVIMQSSSAAVATTLTALSTGAIDVTQAGALVIGQNVGTTVTAGLAAIGASVPARRTALAHVLFNVCTGVVAFGVLPLLSAVDDVLARLYGDGHEVIYLSVFQTSFNLLGLALLLPVFDRFVGAVTRLVPDRGPQLTRYLDRSVTRLAAVALETAHRTLRDITAEVVTLVEPAERPASVRQREQVREALAETRRFLIAVHPEPESADVHQRHVAAIHALDHLEELAELSASAARTVCAADDGLAAPVQHLRAIVTQVRGMLLGSAPDAADRAAAELSALRALIVRLRVRMIDDAATAQLDPDVVLTRLDALRWIDAAAHHLQRTLFHLAGNGRADGERSAMVIDRSEVAAGV